MTEFEKMIAGEPYCFLDPEIEARKKSAVIGCRRFNSADPLDLEEQARALDELLGAHGRNLNMQQGFHCDCGKNIHVGDDFLCNYNLTILDIAEVRIGNSCMIGPNVLITTVGHPLDREGRKKRMAFCKEVVIGDDVWIGANAVILPGVHIGSNVVIGAGAVVTRDLPDNCVAAGVPARKIRSLQG